MTATIKIAEAKAHFSELIARVEAGEELVIARGDLPVARLVPLEASKRAHAAIETLLALRDSGAIAPVTLDEIRAWRHEGHKY
jgi:prevent-host-death family protein